MVSMGALQKATSIVARDQLAGQTAVTSGNSLLHTWVVTAREQEVVWPEISLEVGKGEGTRAMVSEHIHACVSRVLTWTKEAIWRFLLTANFDPLKMVGKSRE